MARTFISGQIGRGALCLLSFGSILTWAAPRCPEVYKHGNTSDVQYLLKLLRVTEKRRSSTDGNADLHFAATPGVSQIDAEPL
jgi:hypothetical protein